MEHTHEDETWQETMAYIQANRVWDTANQRYKFDYRTVMHTPLTDCRIYDRGIYTIVEHNGVVHYWENTKGSYLMQAILIIDPSVPKKWKTLDALITLRQCCRECMAQGWEVDIDRYFVPGISEARFREFLSIGRKKDKIHHGQSTF